MSEQLKFSVSPIVEAFLDTARSRKQAVRTIQMLYGTPEVPIPDGMAVVMVEAYYKQRPGGKPWLHRNRVAP